MGVGLPEVRTESAVGITVDACSVYEDGRILCTAVMPEDAERIAQALNALGGSSETLVDPPERVVGEGSAACTSARSEVYPNVPNPALPAGFDYVDLGILLDLIAELADYLRVGSMDALEGETAAWERAQRALQAYRPASRGSSR